MITEYLLKYSPFTIGLIMMTKWRRLVVAPILILLFVMLSPMSANVRVYGENGRIDLFTQKEPFNGKGPNMSSDAFAPGERVLLYAQVEYNGNPQQNLLVAFSVEGPDKSSFSLTATTNASGIALINFTIPQKCPPHENEVLGEWFASATVRIGDNVLRDTLTFKVGWIIELLGVRTIDGNATPRDRFGIGGDVGLEIYLKNIAKTEKNATLAVVIQDELNNIVNSMTIENIEIQPNEKNVFLYTKLNIPKWAAPGPNATVYVSALRVPEGVAYCPPVSANFIITIYDPIQIEFHDAAIVKITPSATSVKVGEPIYVNVKVRNEGTTNESFTVSLLLNNQVVETLNVLNLAPYSHTILSFTIDTGKMAPGSYLISAFIPPLLNEADTTDNSITDGYIEITSPIKKKFLVTFEETGLSPDAHGTILTVNGSVKTIDDLPYSLLVDEGSTLTYKYEETVLSTISGKRFKLHNVDGPSSPIIVRENITVTANYKTQYYLSVSSIYGSPTPQSGWFDNGTTITASVSSPWPGPEGTRYKCVGWIGTGSVPSSGSYSTVTFTIYQPSSITWLWKTQYYLAVVSPYGVVGGDGWYDANEVAYAFLNIGVFDHKNGTRRVFVSWGGDASGTNYTKSDPILMDRPKTAVANWKTQYLLIVATDPDGLQPQPSRSPVGEAGPAGGWWYDAHVNVSLLALPVAGYDFNHWDVDGVAFEVGRYELTVFMDDPHTATAHYNVRAAGWYLPEWFYWILLVILVLVIVLICVWIYRRRKRAKAGETAFQKGWTAWYYGYDLLGRNRRSK